MHLPESLQRLIDELQKLPTIGQKSAQRLAFHLLARRESDCRDLAAALVRVADELRFCDTCGNLADDVLCLVCKDGERGRRNLRQLCVVEQPLDILGIEKTNEYRGLYHVLGGALSPMKGVNPEHLRINSLLERVRSGPFEEVILATNPNLEGEATGMFLSRLLRSFPVKVTRLAYGLPMGTHLEYTDALTLARALSGRSAFEG